jgi:hypothetical protein
MSRLDGPRRIKCFVSKAVSFLFCDHLHPYILGRALDYRDVIDNFVAKNRELRAYELSTADWDAIMLVMRWLKSFRSATTQMSSTKSSMLSTTHAIFRGLQEDIRHSLAKLPDAAPSQLKTSLIKAHRKLSDYYTKLDESPYYIWASCKCKLFFGRIIYLAYFPQYWTLAFHTKASWQTVGMTNHSRVTSSSQRSASKRAIENNICPQHQLVRPRSHLHNNPQVRLKR